MRLGLGLNLKIVFVPGTGSDKSQIVLFNINSEPIIGQLRWPLVSILSGNDNVLLISDQGTLRKGRAL